MDLTNRCSCARLSADQKKQCLDIFMKDGDFSALAYLYRITEDPLCKLFADFDSEIKQNAGWPERTESGFKNVYEKMIEHLWLKYELDSPGEGDVEDV